MKQKANQSPMLIEERRQHILSIIEKNGRVLVEELSDSLNLSKITIRKDLDYLESRNLLLRTHGGALPKHTGTLVDPSFEEKTQLHHEEKLRIAAEAVKLVEEDQCIILDSGSTTIEIARALKRFHRLTIITNALNIATELVNTDFEVIILGGSLRKKSFSVVGPLSEDMLREFHADLLFLAVDGIDPKVGLTTPNMQESRVNRAMINAADKVVAVCDSTKFERTSHSLIAGLEAVHQVITDKGLPAEVGDAIRALGVELILV